MRKRGFPFSFRERGLTQWFGRYRRIPGKQSVLHVRSGDTVDIVWQDDWDKCICVAQTTPGVQSLAQAVNRVKRQRTGESGGSFVINEYGQVICPVADGSSERFYVGDCDGAITFKWPDGDCFTLDDDEGLETGDYWTLPYVGMAFNLSWDDLIYFQLKEGFDTERVYPPQQDQDLIWALRDIRECGGIRFIVNPHGIVLTKVEDDPLCWKPKYVGRINYECWFAKKEA